MHELHSDRAAIDASRVLGKLAVDRQIGMRHGAEKAERIEIGFQISPAAECVEHALAFPVGFVQYSGGGSGNSLASSGHMSANRIMDEGQVVADSAGIFALRLGPDVICIQLAFDRRATCQACR